MKAYGKKRVIVCEDSICCGDSPKTSKKKERQRARAEIKKEINDAKNS